MNAQITLAFIGCTVWTLLLGGCAPASNAAPVVLTQSPLATPAVSNSAPLVGQSSTAASPGKVRTSAVTVLTKVAAAGAQLVSDDMFFPAVSVGDKLYGTGKQTSGQLALYEVNLKTGLTRQVGAARKGWGNMRASERYVVWDQYSDAKQYTEIHVYDLQTNQESIVAAHSRLPDVSDNIMVWDGVIGYDLAKAASIQTKNLHGQPRYPRISGQWVVYLDAYGDDTADVYAHNLATNEDFKIGVMPTQGQRIGVVDWYPVISGKNIVWVSAQDDKLHHYNLDTRTDRLLPIPLNAETVNGIPRGLELDGDILVYELRDYMGYDLARDVAFPIPVIPAVKGKWTSSTHPLVSGGRLVWQTTVDQETHIYSTEIVREP